MTLRVYTVFDSKIGTYMRPFVMQTKGEALRSWVDIVNDPQTQFNKHPEDFTLFEIAEYDDATGKFTNHPTPVSLGLALEFLKNTYATIGDRSVVGDLNIGRVNALLKSEAAGRSHNKNEVTE